MPFDFLKPKPKQQQQQQQTGTRYPTDFLLGDLLVKAGMVSQQQLDDAVKMAGNKHVHVGQMLINFRYISPRDLQAAVDAQSALRDRTIDQNMAARCLKMACKSGMTFAEVVRDQHASSGEGQSNKLGELLLESGLILKEQYAKSMQRSQATGLPLGRILVLNGAVSDPLLTMALEIQVRIRDGMMTREEAIEALSAAGGTTGGDIQDETLKLQILQPRRKGIRLGELMVLAGLLNETDVMNALELGLVNDEPIGQVLVSQGYISEDILNAGLELQKRVDEDKLLPVDAGEALKQIKATGQDMSSVLDKIDKQAVEADSKTIIAFDKMLLLARVVTQEDIENALEKSAQSPQILGKLLNMTGYIDEFTMNSVLQCYTMLSNGFLTQDDAIVTLDYCLNRQEHVSFAEALSQVGWNATLPMQVHGATSVDISQVKLGLFGTKNESKAEAIAKSDAPHLLSSLLDEMTADDDEEIQLETAAEENSQIVEEPAAEFEQPQVEEPVAEIEEPAFEIEEPSSYAEVDEQTQVLAPDEYDEVASAEVEASYDAAKFQEFDEVAQPEQELPQVEEPQSGLFEEPESKEPETHDPQPFSGLFEEPIKQSETQPRAGGLLGALLDDIESSAKKGDVEKKVSAAEETRSSLLGALLDEAEVTPAAPPAERLNKPIEESGTFTLPAEFLEKAEEAKPALKNEPVERFDDRPPSMLSALLDDILEEKNEAAAEAEAQAAVQAPEEITQTVLLDSLSLNNESDLDLARRRELEEAAHNTQSTFESVNATGPVLLKDEYEPPQFKNIRDEIDERADNFEAEFAKSASSSSGSGTGEHELPSFLKAMAAEQAEELKESLLSDDVLLQPEISELKSERADDAEENQVVSLDDLRGLFSVDKGTNGGGSGSPSHVEPVKPMHVEPTMAEERVHAEAAQEAVKEVAASASAEIEEKDRDLVGSPKNEAPAQPDNGLQKGAKAAESKDHKEFDLRSVMEEFEAASALFDTHEKLTAVDGHTDDLYGEPEEDAAQEVTAAAETSTPAISNESTQDEESSLKQLLQGAAAAKSKTDPSSIAASVDDSRGIQSTDSVTSSSIAELEAAFNEVPAKSLDDVSPSFSSVLQSIIGPVDEELPAEPPPVVAAADVETRASSGISELDSLFMPGKNEPAAAPVAEPPTVSEPAKKVTAHDLLSELEQSMSMEMQAVKKEIEPPVQSKASSLVEQLAQTIEKDQQADQKVEEPAPTIAPAVKAEVPTPTISPVVKEEESSPTVAQAAELKPQEPTPTVAPAAEEIKDVPKPKPKYQWLTEEEPLTEPLTAPSADPVDAIEPYSFAKSEPVEPAVHPKRREREPEQDQLALSAQSLVETIADKLKGESEPVTAEPVTEEESPLRIEPAISHAPETAPAPVPAPLIMPVPVQTPTPIAAQSGLQPIAAQSSEPTPSPYPAAPVVQSAPVAASPEPAAAPPLVEEAVAPPASITPVRRIPSPAETTAALPILDFPPEAPRAPVAPPPVAASAPEQTPTPAPVPPSTAQPAPPIQTAAAEAPATLAPAPAQISPATPEPIPAVPASSAPVLAPAQAAAPVSTPAEQPIQAQAVSPASAQAPTASAPVEQQVPSAPPARLVASATPAAVAPQAPGPTQPAQQPPQAEAPVVPQTPAPAQAVAAPTPQPAANVIQPAAAPVPPPPPAPEKLPVAPALDNAVKSSAAPSFWAEALSKANVADSGAAPAQGKPETPAPPTPAVLQSTIIAQLEAQVSQSEGGTAGGEGGKADLKEALGDALGRLAESYYEQGDYVQAQGLYERMLMLKQNQLGPKHPALGADLTNLAGVLCVQGKFADAEPYVKRICTIIEATQPLDSLKLAGCLGTLASVLFQQGKYIECEPLLERSLKLKQEKLGAEHADTADTLRDYAKLLRKLGRNADAELMYAQAKAILGRRPKQPVA